MRAFYAVVLVFGIQGCDADPEDNHSSQNDDTGGSLDTSDTSDTSSDTDSDDSGDEDPAFMPWQGQWTFVDGEILSDTCEYDYESLPSGGDGFTLTQTENMGFLLLLDGTEDPMICAWDDAQDFGCDMVESGEAIDDLDATITSLVGLSGSFTEETAMGSIYDIGIDCVGDDCYLAEWATGIEFPCQVVVELFASAESESSE